MLIEVDKEEKELILGIRELSQAGRNYIMEKIQLRQSWERFVSENPLGHRETG
jgi:hypothetical protein